MRIPKRVNDVTFLMKPGPQKPEVEVSTQKMEALHKAVRSGYLVPLDPLSSSGKFQKLAALVANTNRRGKLLELDSAWYFFSFIFDVYLIKLYIREVNNESIERVFQECRVDTIKQGISVFFFFFTTLISLSFVQVFILVVLIPWQKLQRKGLGFPLQILIRYYTSIPST